MKSPVSCLLSDVIFFPCKRVSLHWNLTSEDFTSYLSCSGNRNPDQRGDFLFHSLIEEVANAAKT